MIETITLLTFIVVLVNCGWSFYNYKKIENLQYRMDTEKFCRYPDTDIRDIILDYELEKAKKLDKAIHDVEVEGERNRIK
jgi:hypothetical protein